MNRAMHCAALAALLFAIVNVGCGRSPRQKMIGKWKGAPDVSAEVTRLVKEQAAGNKLTEEDVEIVDNLAQFGGKVASRMGMGMETQFQSDGTVSFKGHTEIIGLTGDASGTWELLDPEKPGILRMGPADKQVEGKIVWRDDEAFFFQYEAPLEARTDLIGGPQAEDDDTPDTKTVTLLFRKYLIE